MKLLEATQEQDGELIHFLVMLKDDRLVGICRFRVEEHANRMGFIWYLDGESPEIADRFVKRCIELSPDKLIQTMAKTDSEIALYKKHGFQMLDQYDSMCSLVRVPNK